MSSFSLPPAERWRGTLGGGRFSGAAVALGVFASVQTFETLAAGDDSGRPVVRLDRRTAEDLLRAPPDRPFWFVAREPDLEVLRRAAWRCPPRGKAGEERALTSIARVVPPVRESD